MANIWSDRLASEGHSKRVCQQFPLYLAPSTLRQYNYNINKFYQFCTQRNIIFPAQDCCVLSDYLCFLADSSSRPESILKTNLAALSCFYDAINVPNIVSSPIIQRLFNALVKSGTKEPMQRTTTLPIHVFNEMFHSWGSNSTLDVTKLRLKTIVLLALTLMLRPSDIAPAGVIYNPETHQKEPYVFSTRHVIFHDDGSATIRFLGIKNDSDRSGFQCVLPPAEDTVIDPVQTLKDYINKTELVRSETTNSPVFLTLQRPYKHLTATGIAAVLSTAIKMAGLAGQGFTPRSFRPTGAQAAVDNQTDPKTAQYHGRWRSESIFYTHYVHAKPPKDFSSKLMTHA